MNGYLGCIGGMQDDRAELVRAKAAGVDRRLCCRLGGRWRVGAVNRVMHGRTCGGFREFGPRNRGGPPEVSGSRRTRVVRRQDRRTWKSCLLLCEISKIQAGPAVPTTRRPISNPNIGGIAARIVPAGHDDGRQGSSRDRSGEVSKQMDCRRSSRDDRLRLGFRHPWAAKVGSFPPFCET